MMGEVIIASWRVSVFGLIARSIISVSISTLPASRKLIRANVGSQRGAPARSDTAETRQT